MGEAWEKLMSWVEKDPTHERVGLALVYYNWDSGAEFLHRAVERFDTDLAVLLELTYGCDAGWAGAYGTREEAAEAEEMMLPNYDLLLKIEEGWQAGKFDTQNYGPLEDGRRLVGPDGKIQLDEFADIHPRFTFVKAFSEMRTDLPLLELEVLSEDDDRQFREALYAVGAMPRERRT